MASTTELFLVAMTLVFALPWLLWRLLGRDDWAPLVVVQILAGIALGPGALGAAFPELHQAVFAPAVVQALQGLAWWGVMLFIWLAGIELDLKLAWRHRGESALTAGLALGLPMLLGCIAAGALAALPGWVGPAAAGWQFVVGIGMSCAVTALPVLILLMDKLALLRQPLGQRILRYASLDDVAIWSVLALILMDWQRIGRQALFIAAFAVAAWGLRRLMVRLAGGERWALGLVWLLLVALGADWSGLHFMVGAFLAGAVLDADWFERHELDALRRHVLLIAMPVYFLSTGLRTHWGDGGQAAWIVLLGAALLLAAAVGGKLAGVQLAGRLLGWAPGESQVIGWLLQTKGLVEIVFANVLLDKQLITPAAFTALLLMAVTSTMLSTPIVAPRLARLGAEGPEPRAAGEPLRRQQR